MQMMLDYAMLPLSLGERWEILLFEPGQGCLKFGDPFVFPLMTGSEAITPGIHDV